ncbi:GNAT family N-acetyltransferase [Aureimonas sp. AU4]|uniref:GNAT family N-acetyltransferase n=1 Tax=Aureimonas sp. AU4 TaxID=1638163 RepID=UPI0009E957A4|nr:N-acetyltransferase [Aureimonas sp. AU4]
MSDGPGVTVREMRPDELLFVETIHASAFDGIDEAQLTKAVIESGHETISVVAAHDGFLIGHALFSSLDGPERALALGPVAVAPDRQGAGIGARLIGFGLELARERGWRSVFVLGDPHYYGRFGFRPDLAQGADVPWAGPAFQALELIPGALTGWHGPLVYPEPFSALPE